MEEWALSLAIASIIGNIVLGSGILGRTFCKCPVCQHVKTLSDEAIKDIIEEAIPETKKSN